MIGWSGTNSTILNGTNNGTDSYQFDFRRDEMKEYKAVDYRTGWFFIVVGITFKDCQKQIEHQLGYLPKLDIVSIKNLRSGRVEN